MTTPTKRKSEVTFVDSVSQTFIPKKKVIHHHGKLSISLYPDITSGMKESEKTFAFNANKTAITNELALPYSAKLNIMGEKHNATNLVDVKSQQWKSFTFDQLKNPDNLSVLSYHNNAGTIINDCIDEHNNLKSIQDGAINQCRPNSIMYAKLEATINYQELYQSDQARNRTFQFFVRLPMGTHNVRNNNNIFPIP